MKLSDRCVIEILYELSKESSTQSEICRKYNRTFAAINKAKNYLINLGLVEVIPRQIYKRTRIIGLTQKAKDMEIPRIITEFVKLEKEINK